MELIINHTTINTCLGTIFLAATNKGVCMLEFDNEKRIQHHFKQIEQYHPIKKTDNSTTIIDTAIAQLTEYFNGDRIAFNLPLDLYGSDFQKNVWNELQTIPYGSIRTYKE